MKKKNEWKVKVFCPQCGLIFWEDELLQWTLELDKCVFPAWFTKARLHDKETGHQVMVEFPNQSLPMKLEEVYGVYY